ncbi:hypothetical protein TNIN_106451, partial [Trichonephila inaurata madagascariensis]
MGEASVEDFREDDFADFPWGGEWRQRDGGISKVAPYCSIDFIYLGVAVRRFVLLEGLLEGISKEICLFPSVVNESSVAQQWRVNDLPMPLPVHDLVEGIR